MKYPIINKAKDGGTLRVWFQTPIGVQGVKVEIEGKSEEQIVNEIELILESRFAPPKPLSLFEALKK